MLGFLEAVSKLLDGIMPGGTASLVMSLLRVLKDMLANDTRPETSRADMNFYLLPLHLFFFTGGRICNTSWHSLAPMSLEMKSVTL